MNKQYPEKTVITSIHDWPMYYLDDDCKAKWKEDKGSWIGRLKNYIFLAKNINQQDNSNDS